MPIHQYPKPDLSGYEIRQITVPKSKHQLEGALVPWISEVVRRLKQPSSPRYTAKFLVEAAPGKDEILSAPPGLSLGRGNVQKIRAKFNLINGNHNGSWYLRSVEFSPELCDAQKASQDKDDDDNASDLRKDLEDAARAENRLHPKAQAFKVELHMDSWADDVDAGRGVIQLEMDTAHDYAKKAAAIPENFYTPKDMVKDTIMLGVGKAVGLAAKKATAVREEASGALERAKDLATPGMPATGDVSVNLQKAAWEEADKVPGALEKAHKGMEYFLGGVEAGEEAGKQWRETNQEEKGELARSQSEVYHKTKGDAIAQGVVSVLSMVPGGGTFVKMFAGMFMDIGASNYAGKVTKVRIRAYSWFVTGCIQGLTGVTMEPRPTEKFDDIFYSLAYRRAAGMSEDARFQAQIFLLAYSSGHYLLGTTSPGEAIEHPDKWSFPDGYLAHWSPERLGRSLATLLRTYDYLVN